MKNFIILIIGLMLTTFANALQPFELDIEGYYYKGITIQIHGVQELKQINETEWEMSLTAEAPFAYIHEVSRFKFEDNIITPIKYEKTEKIGLSEDKETVLFLENEAMSTVNDEKSFIEFEDPVYDSLTYMLVLMREFQETDSVDIQLISDNQLKEYQFEKQLQLNDDYYMFKQIKDGYYTTVAVVNEEKQIPSNMLEWRKDKLKYQLKIINAKLENDVLNNFTYWENPKDNIPN